jgi:hypothetical protein
LLATAAGSAPKRTFSVRTDPKSHRTFIRLSGVPAEKVLKAVSTGGASDRLFFVAVEPAAKAQAIPVLALVAVISPEVVELRPVPPLTPGTAYVVEFEGPNVERSLPHLTHRFRLPHRKGTSSAKVSAIFPTQERVPANLLKFYIRFTASMGEGKVFQHIRLLDAKGKPIAQAFRERELWSETHRRLTLWINPGRTKKSLGLSESLGPVLTPGREYSLEIGAGLTDQEGLTLGKAVRKRFRTVAADKKQPRIADWKLEVPKAGTLKPLTVRFGEPLDRALVERVISLQQAKWAPAGKRVVAADCRSWQFTPTAAWKAGDYRLVAAGELEDLAGNSLYRAFETHAGTLPATSPPVFERLFKLR